MHSRKKLQKKETSAPNPESILSMKSLRGPMCCVRRKMFFLNVNHSGVIRESRAKIREGLNQKREKKKKKNVSKLI